MNSPRVCKEKKRKEKKKSELLQHQIIRSVLTHSTAYGLMRIRAVRQSRRRGSHVMMRTQSSGETEAAQPIGQSRLGGGVVLTSVTWPIAHRAQRVDEPGGRRVSQKSTSRSSMRMRGLKPGTEREGRAWRRGEGGRDSQKNTAQGERFGEWGSPGEGHASSSQLTLFIQSFWKSVRKGAGEG